MITARILYADDDQTLARLVEAYLGRAGLTVTHADGAEKAAALLHAQAFDVLVTDYRMEDASGLDLIRRARDIAPDMPIIMVSGAGNLTVAVEAMKLGAADYVVKDGKGAYLDLLPGVIIRLLERRSMREEKLLAEAALEEERRLSRLAVESLPQAFLVWDAQFRVRLANSRMSELGSYPPELLQRGADVADIVRLDAERGIFGPGAPEELAAKRMSELGQWLPYKRENAYPNGIFVEVSGVPLPDGFYVLTITDITERKRAEDGWRHDALHDRLTNLPNRAAFQEEIVRRLKGGPFALLFLDLNGFKPVNDNFGHEVGDLLLQAVSRRLLGCVRETDMVARLGGDEFTILLGNVEDPVHIDRIAGKVITSLSRPFKLRTHQVEISASVGVARFPHDGASLDELVRKADLAMYAEKRGVLWNERHRPIDRKDVN